MTNNILFKLAHEASFPGFFKLYKSLGHNLTSTEINENQNNLLSEIIKYSYEEVPYYHELFDSLNITPNQIKNTNDLVKIPILTKKTVLANWERFKPINLSKISFKQNSTGGTTGTPFIYRVSRQDRFLSLAILYRGWGKAGYIPGDRMVFFGGASLDISPKTSLSKKLQEFSRNIKKLSSFEMSEDILKNYVSVINNFKPTYIRGYPSSISFFCSWIRQNNIGIHKPSAVFTTSEKLSPDMRKNISETFCCEVFDTYGLNDGGLSAFECNQHSGLHIDTERGYAETVDDNNNRIYEKEGRILATTLTNKAMPLLRYDTGDIGIISKKSCTCGDAHPLMTEIVGRSTDILVTPEGKKVHGWFFLYVFWKYYKGIVEYQVVQNSPEEIDIFIVKGGEFNESIINDIRKTSENISKSWNLSFKFVDKIPRNEHGKFKFIINNIK